jgi:hypothetical protein
VQEDGALDAYLLWKFSRKPVLEVLEYPPIDLNRIFGEVALIREKIVGLSVEAKLTIVASQHQVRADRLRTKRWTLEEYPVSGLGTVLPYVGDLPLAEVVKSFAAVADFVKLEAESGSTLKSIRYIHSLSRVAAILETIPVMVIEPGSEQRRPNVLKERGREDVSIFLSEGYIEDGNHRALALMLANPHRKTVPCWVGR